MESELIEFSKMRFKGPGAYLNIPKRVLDTMKFGHNSVIKITFVDTPTPTNSYDVINKIYSGNCIYLRKLDLKMLGIEDSEGGIGGIIIPKLKGRIQIISCGGDE